MNVLTWGRFDFAADNIFILNYINPTFFKPMNIPSFINSYWYCFLMKKYFL